MAESNGPNGAVSKVVAGILALMALIGGVAAIVAPMNQRIEAIEKGQERHEGAESHIGTASQLAAIREKFVEIETQFRGERQQRLDLAVLLDRRLAALDEKLQMEIAAEITRTGILREVSFKNHDDARADRVALRAEVHALALQVERLKAAEGK